MNIVSNQTALDRLREHHQEEARKSAATENTPVEFLGDPCFSDLVHKLSKQDDK